MARATSTPRNNTGIPYLHVHIKERPDTVLPAEEDLVIEEKLLHSPHDVKIWIAYLDSKNNVQVSKRFLLFERAVNALPGSYKVTLFYPQTVCKECSFNILSPNSCGVHT